MLNGNGENSVGRKASRSPVTHTHVRAMMALTARGASSKARDPWRYFRVNDVLACPSFSSSLRRAHKEPCNARLCEGGEFPKESVIDHPFRLNLLPSSDPCDLNLLLSLYICMYMYIYTREALSSHRFSPAFTHFILSNEIFFSRPDISLYFFTSIEKYDIPRRYTSWKILSLRSRILPSLARSFAKKSSLVTGSNSPPLPRGINGIKGKKKRKKKEKYFSRSRVQSELKGFRTCQS